MPGTTENTADKWDKQRAKQRDIAREYYYQLHGEVINDEED